MNEVYAFSYCYDFAIFGLLMVDKNFPSSLNSPLKKLIADHSTLIIGGREFALIPVLLYYWTQNIVHCVPINQT